MSTHGVNVFLIKEIKPHPNADFLGIIDANGWDVIIKLGDYNVGDLVIHVEPDYVVPDIELFAWLKYKKNADGNFVKDNNGNHVLTSKNWDRIRARKFCQRYSHGILVPAPEGLKEGDEAMELLGIERFEPPLPLSAGGDNERGPAGFYPKYDVENLQRFQFAIQADEEVVATEKLHGANAKYCWTEDRMWVGSRTNWKAQSDKNLWWQALAQNPWIEPWCKANPGLVLYGEVFGQVQDLKYGSKPGQVMFRAFDILDHDRWLDFDEARQIGWDLQWVPLVYCGPFDEAKLMELALGDSDIDGAQHMKEGVVIKPVKERRDPELGRVQLKLVSPRYLARK